MPPTVITPLDLPRFRYQEFEEFEEWVAIRIRRRARASLAESKLPLETRERITAEIAAKPVMFGELWDWMLTKSGYGQAVLISLRIARPETTPADVEALEFEEGTPGLLVRKMLGLPTVVAQPPSAVNAQEETPDSPPPKSEETPG